MFPDVFGLVHARAEGVVFTPSVARHLLELKKWLWSLWRVSPFHWEKLIVQQSQGAGEICWPLSELP